MPNSVFGIQYGQLSDHGNEPGGRNSSFIAFAAFLHGTRSAVRGRLGTAKTSRLIASRGRT
jgi:hypothetical protein